MPSNEDIFHTILSGAPAQAAVAARVGAERRRSFRLPVGLVGTVARELHGEIQHPLSVYVLNVSDHGVGLRSPVHFHRESVYRLTIGRENADLKRFKVVSSRKRDDGTFDVGGELI